MKNVSSVTLLEGIVVKQITPYISFRNTLSIYGVLKISSLFCNNVFTAIK